MNKKRFPKFLITFVALFFVCSSFSFASIFFSGYAGTAINTQAVKNKKTPSLTADAFFAGQLDFNPTKKVMESATLYADNVKQISPERIYAELVEILKADKAYNFSNKQGHYKALKILEKTGALDVIFPELTEGRDMAQRADFHLYDVLEHSLRCALYADEEVRLASLLHDIGKPYCFKKEGSYYRHFLEGEKIAQKVLKRLKVSNKIISEVKFLIRQHMVDIDCSMKENKVKKFIVKKVLIVSKFLQRYNKNCKLPNIR